MKKTTPKHLSKRLTQYGALTAAIAGVVDASGQVVYTPLGTTHADAATYALDMNNEAPNEFEFNQAGNNLFVQPTSVSASILGSRAGAYSSVYPFALNSGAVVSSAQASWFPADPFVSQVMNFSNCGFYNSNWCNPTTDKFLGLRFSISGQIHYGWARVSVYSLPSDEFNPFPAAGWAITGYAYEATPNTAIMTDNTLGNDDLSLNKLKIVALRKSIALYNLPDATNYTLYTITGQKVKEGSTNQDTYVIENETLANGIYVLEIKDKNSKAVLKKKVVL